MEGEWTTDDFTNFFREHSPLKSQTMEDGKIAWTGGPGAVSLEREAFI